MARQFFPLGITITGEGGTVAVEDVRVRLRRKLEEMVGVDEADLLMDRPPGGWGDLVTKDWLREELDRRDAVFEARFLAVDYRLDGIDHRLEAIDQRFESFDRRFEALDRRFGAIDRRFESFEGRFESFDGRLGDLRTEINNQTWRLVTAMLVGMSILTAVFGTFVAMIQP